MEFTVECMSTTVWRISKKKYAATAFSGEGAKLVGGRWNSQGNSIVYTSASLSLMDKLLKKSGFWVSKKFSRLIL